MQRRPKPTIAIGYLTFIMLGIPDGLLGVAWPSIADSFGLPLGALGALIIALVIGFLISTSANGYLLARLGTGPVLAIGVGGLGLSLAGFALAPSWIVFLAVGVFGGMASGLIDAGYNTYAALNFSPRVMNWLHAAFGVGATIGPLIMTRLLEADRPWEWGYLIAACGQFALVLVLLFYRGMWLDNAAQTTAPAESAPQGRAPTLATLRLPVVWLSILLFAAYTGVELAVGSWAFTLLTEGRAVAEGLAGLWVSIYWGSLTAGRIGFGIAITYIEEHILMRIALVGTVVGALLIAINIGDAVTFAGLALIGAALAPIFPFVMKATPQRLAPEHVANTIGFELSAAGVGVAILPSLIGVGVDHFGVESIGPALVIGALLLVSFYALLALYSPARRERTPEIVTT